MGPRTKAGKFIFKFFFCMTLKTDESETKLSPHLASPCPWLGCGPMMAAWPVATGTAQVCASHAPLRAGCGQFIHCHADLFCSHRHRKAPLRYKSLATLLSCRAEPLHFIGNWSSDTATFGIKAYTERRHGFTPHPSLRVWLHCTVTRVWMAES